MESKVYTRLWKELQRMNMQDRVEMIPCRFGYEYLEIACNNRYEREAVINAAKIKGAMIETFFPGLHDSIGVVKVHDAAGYRECRRKIDAEMARVEDWWLRYHEADAETKKLMACGKVE